MPKKILKATHIGTLTIGKIVIPCAVLEDGTRILRERSVATVLGRKGGGSYWQKKKEVKGALLPEYLAVQNIDPFIGDELRKKLLKPTIYAMKSGLKPKGLSAELLPEICNVWLEAREKSALTDSQKKVAKKAELLIRALAHVGIIALVDEATGYQEIRDRQALRIILDKYLTDEWAKWTKTFPDEYYKELFRLKGIAYPGNSGKRPSYVGHWTNDIIYSRLGPGILKELKKKIPRSTSGSRPRKFFVHLTQDIGQPELRELLSNVIFLMKGANSWNDFIRILNRSRSKYGDTMPINFTD